MTLVLFNDREKADFSSIQEESSKDEKSVVDSIQG